MKIKKCIMLIIIAILSISVSVNASTTDSYKISLSANKTTLKEEETLTLAMKATDIKIQSGEKGIGSYEGTLVYDEAVFEEVKMKGNDNWDTPVLNEKRFTSVRSDAKCTSEDQEIAVITLKVKKGANAGKTKIQIKDFEASNGLTNVANNGTEIKIKIENTETEKPGNTGDVGGTGNTGNAGSTGNTGNVGGTGNAGNASGTGSTGTNNSKSPTSSQSTSSKSAASESEQKTSMNKLPHTGVSSTIIIIIVGVAAVGIFSYTRYKNTY